MRSFSQFYPWSFRFRFKTFNGADVKDFQARYREKLNAIDGRKQLVQMRMVRGIHNRRDSFLHKDPSIIYSFPLYLFLIATTTRPPV